MNIVKVCFAKFEEYFLMKCFILFIKKEFFYII